MSAAHETDEVDEETDEDSERDDDLICDFCGWRCRHWELEEHLAEDHPGMGHGIT